MTYLINTKTYEQIIVAEWVKQVTTYDDKKGIIRYISYKESWTGREDIIGDVVNVSIISKYDMTDKEIRNYRIDSNIEELKQSIKKLETICETFSDLIDIIDLQLESMPSSRLEEIEYELKDLMKEFEDEISREENSKDY